MENRYGKDHVTSIGTYTTMKTKAAIKDLARIRGISPDIMNYITATFTRSGTKWIHLFQDASNSNPFKKWMQSEVEGENHNFAYEIINDISLIINQPKTPSIHASGVVITPKSYNGAPMTIFDWMPVRKSGEGMLISEWEGPTIEEAGFLKEDILGLAQLDKFKYIFDFIGKEIDFEDPEIDYNDPDVMEYFKKGYNQDVFQIGTSGLSQYCQKLQPEGILDLIATISLFRPGAMGSGSHITYIRIKNGRMEPTYDHELLKPVTEPTYGLYIYQEQVMKAVQILGGFTLAEADDVRKAMGKKNVSKMAEAESQFIQGALSKGCGRDIAQDIWNELKEFAGYGFNKSHAAAYAITGYFCQWLKHYYGMGYWHTALQEANDKQIPIRINEINKLKKEGLLSFTIAPPDINESEEKFKAVGDTIYWGLDKISYAGEAVLKAIKTERAKSRFFSFEEFYERINRSVVNKRVMLNLILSGCFDSLSNVGNDYVKRLDLVNELHGIARGESPELLYSDQVYEKWFFPLLQRDVSGMSEIDYDSIIDESNIRDAKVKYMSGEEISNKHYDSKWDDKNVSRPSKKIIATGILDKILIRKSVHGDFAQLILDENGWLFEVTVWAEEWIEQQEDLSKQVGRIVVISGSVSPDYFSRKWTIKFLSNSSLECL